MSGWLARLRRVETLDAEVAALRAELAIEAERARGAAAIGMLGERLVALHETALASAAAIAAIDARLAAVEARVASAPAAATIESVAEQGEAIATLRATLSALDRQTRHDVARADQAVEALRDRIEAIRRGDASVA